MLARADWKCRWMTFEGRQLPAITREVNLKEHDCYRDFCMWWPKVCLDWGVQLLGCAIPRCCTQILPVPPHWLFCSGLMESVGQKHLQRWHYLTPLQTSMKPIWSPILKCSLPMPSISFGVISGSTEEVMDIDLAQTVGELLAQMSEAMYVALPFHTGYSWHIKSYSTQLSAYAGLPHIYILEKHYHVHVKAISC